MQHRPDLERDELARPPVPGQVELGRAIAPADLQLREGRPSWSVGERITCTAKPSASAARTVTSTRPGPPRRQGVAAGQREAVQELMRMWPELYLPRGVWAAWQDRHAVLARAPA